MALGKVFVCFLLTVGTFTSNLKDNKLPVPVRFNEDLLSVFLYSLQRVITDPDKIGPNPVGSYGFGTLSLGMNLLQFFIHKMYEFFQM
jgi:hypothetical protein